MPKTRYVFLSLFYFTFDVTEDWPQGLVHSGQASTTEQYPSSC